MSKKGSLAIEFSPKKETLEEELLDMESLRNPRLNKVSSDFSRKI